MNVIFNRGKIARIRSDERERVKHPRLTGNFPDRPIALNPNLENEKGHSLNNCVPFLFGGLGGGLVFSALRIELLHVQHAVSVEFFHRLQRVEL